MRVTYRNSRRVQLLCLRLSRGLRGRGETVACLGSPWLVVHLGLLLLGWLRLRLLLLLTKWVLTIATCGDDKIQVIMAAIP
jgi:hypothetical protein